MKNLSRDELFIVLEFLPIRDIYSVLMTCSDIRKQLDSFEPFWRVILKHFLVSNIKSQFRKLIDDIFNNNHNNNEERMRIIIHKMNIMKNNDDQMKVIVSKLLGKQRRGKFIKLNRALLNSFINSLQSLLLKPLNGRKSLEKFVDKSGGESITNNLDLCMNGKRYKYLVERQSFSIVSIYVSTFFDWYYHSEYMEAFIYPMLIVFTGREHIPSSKCRKEDFQFGMKAFSLFFKYHSEIGNSEMCWRSILRACFNHLDPYVQVEECAEVLKHFVGIKLKSPLSVYWVETVFLGNEEYFKDILPLIMEMFERYGVESDDWPDTAMYQRLNKVKSIADELLLAQKVVRFFKYLERFRTRESIISSYLQNFLLESICQLSNSYIDELLKLYPIDLTTVSFLDCAKLRITGKFLKITTERGINFPLESIEQAIQREYSYTTSQTIRYVMDKFHLTVFQIQERTGFLSRLLAQYVGEWKQTIDLIFPESIVEWKKLGAIRGEEDQIKDTIIKQLTYFTWKYESDFNWIRDCFKPCVFDLDLLENIIYGLNPTHYLTLYNITLLNEKELLSEYTEKILREEEEQWSSFMNDDFENYSRDDPRYLIALYRFVHNPIDDNDIVDIDLLA